MPTVQPVLTRLVELAHPRGGWGYRVGAPPQPEPTCLALLALHRVRAEYRTAFDAGLAALARDRHTDGSYCLPGSRPEATWPTAIALFTHVVLGSPVPTLQPTVERLIGTESRVLSNGAETEDMESDIDLSLVGWPWSTDNFGWVEPTSWAVLALRAAGFEWHPRVRQGVKLLLDRAFDSGGANYGNRVVLGSPTEPIPGPTALMLIALQGVVDHPRIDAAVGYLRMAVSQSRDLEHLAWGRLALGLYDTDSATSELLPPLDAKILSVVQQSPSTPYRLALAALALLEENPFRLPERSPAPPEHVSGVRSQPKPARPGASGGLVARLSSRFRGLLASGVSRLKPFPATPAVHIARAASYDAPLAEILARQYEHFRGVQPLAGKRVVIKPNLVEYRPDRVINTNPKVVDAVITLCKQEGAAEIIVAEGPGHWRNAPFLVEQSGLGAVLESHGVPFVDLNHDEPVKVLNLGRLTRLDHLYLARTVWTADVLISLPKLKTHHWAGVTLSLKNLFGTLPGICYGWPKNELHWRGIPQSIVDIACTRGPDLAIVDAITGMEGDGPLNGMPKQVGALVMGVDPLAVDATATRLMGIVPERIPTFVLAATKRIGRIRESDIPQIGQPIATLMQQFELPPLIERELLPLPAAAGS